MSSQSLAQPDCGRRFALPQRGWGDPSHNNVEPIGFVLQLIADGDQDLTQGDVSERTASFTREGGSERGDGARNCRREKQGSCAGNSRIGFVFEERGEAETNFNKALARDGGGEKLAC